MGGLFAFLFVSLSSCISIVTVSCGCVAYKPSDADELSEVTCLHYHASEVWTVSVSTVYGATLPSADHVT